MNKLRQCNEGYQLFLDWYKALNDNPYYAVQARIELDDHFKNCPVCKRDKEKNERNGTGTGSDKQGA